MANFDSEVLSFDSALEEILKCLSEFNMSRALVSENDLLAVLPTGSWKSLIFQVLVLMKEIMTGNIRA